MPGTYISGFWGADGAAGTTQQAISGRNRIRRTINRDQMRVFTELFDTLIGATAGSTALATHARVGQQFGPSGGNEAAQVITVTDINRATTAADVTALKEMVFGVRTRPTPYVRDLSGNGGPAFS